MSQKWSYNNLEFEVDLQDADFAERYENAFKQMEEEEKRVQKDTVGCFLTCLIVFMEKGHLERCLREK